MRVLSLFDGLSGCRLALQSLGVTPSAYYASEIDKHPIAVSARNFPDIIRLGDVRNVEAIEDIDLLIFGSPCTDLSSIRQKRQGLEGAASGLFFEALRLLKECKPKHFVMENVASMSSDSRDRISEALGVQPIKINSSLLTAQNRNRYYWCSFPVEMPEDKGIKLLDILEPLHEIPDKYFLLPRSTRHMEMPGLGRAKRWLMNHHCDTDKDKSQCQRVTDMKTRTLVDRRATYPYIRLFTPTESERLQGVPKGYTEGVSDTQRYRMLGNGFTIPVIAHILSHIV